MLKHYTNLTALITGLICSILGLELLFRLFPVKQVHKFAENNISKPVLQDRGTSFVEPIDWKFSQTQYRRINNYGFVDDGDYVPKSQPIAVIGDSYIQSAMLPYADTLQGQLASKFGKKPPVYSFGIPMYSLASYLGTTEYATKEFQPQAFVFLLTKGDLSESIQAQDGSYFLDRPDGELKFKDAKTSRADNLLYRSALWRYLTVQINFDAEKIVKDRFDPPSPQPKLTHDTYQKIANRLLDLYAVKTNVKPENTIFIIDSDRDSIYNSKLKPDRDELLTFKTVAIARGYQVIDTQDLFKPYYQRNHKKLDFSPRDFHWNERGHKLVANEIAPILAKIITRDR